MIAFNQGITGAAQAFRAGIPHIGSTGIIGAGRRFTAFRPVVTKPGQAVSRRIQNQ
jgi:hypothetical protein